MRHLPCCVVLVAAMLSGCQRNISGTYLASDRDAVCWLQVVRTPDNHLTGQLATSILGPDGRIERNAVSITGAVDDDHVTLSGTQLFGLQTITLSGSLHGNKLTLTGVEPAPLVLTRADLSAYQEKLNALSVKSQSFIEANNAAIARQKSAWAQQSFVADVDQTVAKMRRFEAEADVHLERFPGVEKRYHAITAKMTAYIDRERQLAKNPQAGVARGQLFVAATQASIATDQLHNSGELLQSSLQTNIRPIAITANELEQKCRAVAATLHELTEQQIEVRTAACTRLSLADAPFRLRLNSVSAGLSHLEQVYLQERNSQQKLVHTAYALE